MRYEHHAVHFKPCRFEKGKNVHVEYCLKLV